MAMGRSLFDSSASVSLIHPVTVLTLKEAINKRQEMCKISLLQELL